MCLQIQKDLYLLCYAAVKIDKYSGYRMIEWTVFTPFIQKCITWYMKKTWRLFRFS